MTQCSAKPPIASCFRSFVEPGNIFEGTNFVEIRNWLPMIPLHYWLRWSIGFWNVQKVDKSRQLFLIQKTHQVIFAACFELVMTPILRRKKIWWRWYGIIGQNYGKCSKKVEDGLIRGWFFVWWKYIPYREKKLKIATLNETGFMVKLTL